MAVGCLLALWRFRGVPDLVSAMDPDLRTPVGVALLLPGGLPPVILSLLLLVGMLGAVAHLLHARTRLSLVTAVAAVTILTTEYWSWQATWSHGANALLLAGWPVALAQPRSGRTVLGTSTDRQSRVGPVRGTAIRSAQALLALFFASAFVHKVTRVGLDWADAENLSNILMLRYDTFETPRRWFVDLLLGQPQLAMLAAHASLLLQAVPLVLLPLLHRRWARAVTAASWVLESASIGLVMALFGGEMVPLAAVFLDGSQPRATLHGQAADEAGRRLGRSLVVVACLVLVAAQAVVGLRVGSGHEKLYPLTSAPMYAATYGDEQVRGRFRFVPPAPADLQEHVTLRHSGAFSVDSRAGRDELVERLVRVLGEAQGGWGFVPTDVVIENVTWRLRRSGSTREQIVVLAEVRLPACPSALLTEFRGTSGLPPACLRVYRRQPLA